MQLYNFKKSNIFESFQTVSSVPTNNLVAWMETSQYDAASNNYSAIDNWTPVSTAPNANFFTNTNPDLNTLPFVKTNVLNGHAVLHFTPNKYLSLNNLNGASGDYTIIMVSRQVGASNKRFVQGNGNSAYGYYNGKKEVLMSDTLSRDSQKNSDSNWDLFTIRRSSANNGINYINNFGTPLYCKPGMSGLNGLNINTGGSPTETSDGEMAEFILYNTCLSDSDVTKIELYLAVKWGLLANMDPNIPGSTNTTAIISGTSNATAPISASSFPVTNVKLWVDAASISNPINGNQINTWNSITTDNAYFLQIVNGSKSPILKTNVLNKLPVLEFSLSSKMQMNKTITPTQFTLAFVSRQNGGNNARFLTGSDTTTDTSYGYFNGTKQYLKINGTVLVAPGSGSIISDTNWDFYIITQNYRGGVTMIRNGQTIVNNLEITSGFNGIGINMFGTETSDGQVAEIIVWDRCLLNTEISVIYNYLVKKWNLQLLLPTTDPLYAEGVTIKAEQDAIIAAYVAQEAKIKAEQDAAIVAALQKRIQAAADEQAAIDLVIIQKHQAALAVAQEELVNAAKTLADAQLKSKIASEEQAASSAAIQAKQYATILAAQEQDAILKATLANKEANLAQIIAASNAYADQQKLIQQENNILWSSKLANMEQTLVDKTNLCNTQLATTIAENNAKLNTALSIAETNYDNALKEVKRLNNIYIDTIKSENSQLINSELTTKEEQYQSMIANIIKQKNTVQEMDAKLLADSLKAAQETLNQNVSQTNNLAIQRYNSLQEDSIMKQNILAEQLIDLQNKYNKQISTITQDAKQQYNALQESDIQKIKDLQNQIATTNNNLRIITEESGNVSQLIKSLQENDKNTITNLQNQLATTNNNLRIIREEGSGISNSAYQLLKINDEKAYNELKQKYIQVVASNKKNAALLAKLLGTNDIKKSKKDKKKPNKIDSKKPSKKKVKKI